MEVQHFPCCYRNTLEKEGFKGEERINLDAAEDYSIR